MEYSNKPGQNHTPTCGARALDQLHSNYLDKELKKKIL